ncbi:MAG TPA: hypothetical protein VM364_18650 [Vicinamibacterales bacterium]|nr:hypothetical protein [Vicinamibacterales bacterium]HWI18873.1 hypothetical protein [Vicinamibacterales bacterium]
MRSVDPNSEVLERVVSQPLSSLTFSDLAEYQRKLTAIETYLRKRGDDLDRQNDAAECRLRVERALGNLLTETVVPRGNHGGVVGASKSLPDGVTKKQSLIWRREAAVPEVIFEQWAAETRQAGGELTSSGLLNVWAELFDQDGPKPSRAHGGVFPDERIIDAAFFHFRQTGFPYRQAPLHVAMQEINRLAATKPSKLLTTTAACVVADAYHPHRFRATRDGHRSVVEAFESDAHLRRALLHELKAGHPIPAGFFAGLQIVSGTAPCSNFRPGVALHYYRKYCPPAGTVLDTSTGYGGRLVGFVASGRARYIGIDPNRETHTANLHLAADLGFTHAVELYCSPVEDLDAELVRGRCDFALTSPPYFTKEHYSEDDTQSWKRYPTPDAWRGGFLRPMLSLQFEALRPGSISVINVDDVRIRSSEYAVSEWTTEIAREVGFELIDIDHLTLPQTYWSKRGGHDPSEPIFIFRKP